MAKRWRHLKRIVNKVEADPNAKYYMDEALTPVAEEDSEHMELYTQNEAARVAVERELRVASKNGHAKVPAAAVQHTNGHQANHAAGTAAAPKPASEPSEPISPLV